MKRVLKKILPQNSNLYALVSFFYNWRDKYWQPLRYDNLNKLIALYAEANSQIIFVQVGSNDGISNDPLNKFVNAYQWKGFCIEPVTENFIKLELTYINNAQIILLNRAIGPSGSLKLYFINPEKAKRFNIDLPSWYNQLASFDKDLVVADIQGLDKYKIVDEIEVSSMSFEELVEEFKITRINLLHVDVEGADWKVLSSFPFYKLKPEILIFEHNHLSLKDYKDAVIFLQSINYKLLKVGTDTFAYLNHQLFESEFKNAYKVFKTKRE